MSSNRQQHNPFPLRIDTFGKAPASIYLCHLINVAQDRNSLRKVSAILQAQRSILNELVNAHAKYDVVSTKTLGALLTMISVNLRDQIGKGLRKDNPFYADLVVNIIEGDIKTWRNRLSEAKKRFTELQRRTPHGTALEHNWCPAEELKNEKNDQTLKERSKRYLARKGKQDTLY